MGQEREQYVDGTGFFGFVHLPPGEYKVTVQPRVGKALTLKVKVEAGKVTTCNLLLGSTPAKRVKNLADLSRLPEGTEVLLEEQAVTAGMPGTAGDFQIGEVTVRIPVDLPLPFIQGDVVNVKGTLRRENGQVVIDGAKAVLVDMLPKR